MPRQFNNLTAPLASSAYYFLSVNVNGHLSSEIVNIDAFSSLSTTVSYLGEDSREDLDLLRQRRRVVLPVQQ